MYKVGPLSIEIQNLYSDQPIERLVTFRVYNGKYDILYNVSYVKSINLPLDLKKHLIYQSKEIVVAKNNDIKRYYHIYQHNTYALVEELSSTRYNIILLNDILTQKLHPYFFPELLHLERGLMLTGSFVLHSSYVAIEEGAILFTAKSGGGKSTQAELWKRYKNAEIINGDKSIIGKEDGRWNAYGIPFSGSSEYCVNKTCPLKAIVILDKGPENRLAQVGVKGFQKVFSQVTINPWDKEFCEKAMDIVMDVCSEMPIYYFSCTKTKESVDVLYKELVEKGILNGAV